MGVQEFDAMFHGIDLARKGFVTVEEIYKFCEDLYFSQVFIEHVEGAVRLVCQDTGRVKQTEFLEVLTDIERRRSIDEQAYWDFQALDYYGSCKIALRDALLLFKDYHGENFSMTAWRRFLNSRDYPDMEVHFDEIRFWLCAPAAGQPCSNTDVKDEEKQLMIRQAEFEHSEYLDLKNHIDDEESLQKEREEHNADTGIHARRKLNKWNREGVEAMLFDDGVNAAEATVKVKAKSQVTMNDLKELLEMKYDILKERLMLEMAKMAAPVDDEVEEVLNQIRKQSKQLIMEGSKFSGNLPASQMQVMASLTGLMGELRLQDREHRKQIEQLKARMKGEGRTPREINMAVQEQYEKIISGDNTAAAVLIQTYQRLNQERDSMFSVLKQDPQKTLQQAMSLEYCRVMRQLLVMEEETTFISMATTAGLAERAMEPKIDRAPDKRADWDRSRSERLAEIWLKEHINTTQIRSPKEVPDDSFLQTVEAVDLQVHIVREITQKHFYEREALIHLLLSKEFVTQLARVKKVKPEDRKHQLKGLYNQHLSWKSNPKADIKSLHSILSQALWLSVEERRREIMENSGGASVSDEEMREVMLADLQQRQGLDFEMLLQDVQNMKKEEIIQIWKKQCIARISEVYDNVAVVVLGTLDITAEDAEYIKALEGKYEVLRKRILLMSLKDSTNWDSLSKVEKKAALKDISVKERLLRSEGKLQQMEPLCGPNAKMMPTLRSLVGEDKAEFKRRKNQHKMDEDPNGRTKVQNLLADLVPRFDSEHEYLLSWLHSPEAKSVGLRMKRMRIVETKVETARVEMEDEFEVAACSMGLMERVMETLSQRHTRDRERQDELARKRVQIYRHRIQQNMEYRKEPAISRNDMPARGNITGLQVVYVKEMLKRHTDERELILSYLMDESMEDLLEVAATISAEERQRRLVELQGKHQNLNLTYPDDKEEHVSILEEAAAIRIVGVKQRLGKMANMESVSVTLLAELQEEQDREVALTLQQIENMNEEDIHTSFSREINNRKLGTSWNVINVFTRYQGEATNENLLKALEEKYVMLRKQLLADSLRIRIGTDQWEQFSEAERQQKVEALDFQAQEQIRLGHILSSLLGDDFVLHETVEESMGVCPHVFKNKVKGQQSLGHESNLHMEEDSGAVSKKGKKPNPMKDLYKRFEEERLALVRQLKGQSEDYISEKERQMLLTSYHRQCTLASQAESYISMATMLGLMERQQEEIKFRLIKDRLRYENLGRNLVFQLREDDSQKVHQTELGGGSSVTVSIDCTLKALENKHIQERAMFYRFLASAESKSEIHTEASLFSQQQRLDKIAELRKERTATLESKQKEDLEALSVATVYKMEDRRSCLFDTQKVDNEDVSASLLADLLEYQNCEAQKLVLELAQKDSTDIAQFLAAILNSIKVNMADNVALVVLYPDRVDGATDTELVEALKGKYDALKDKLLAEALMRELGESEWNRLSETERQRKIFELKMKEKQLRKEGKIDEANALLDELMKDQEHLRQLMGDTAAMQRQKLKERLHRRQRRISQGMTKEEIDAFEKEDIANDEEEEKYEERNILEDLNDRFEQEKAELMRKLKEAGDEQSRERERQAQLAKLRRDQRLARKEGDFSAAALILGLSEKQDKDLHLSRDAERMRQERLAYERLAAARKRKAKGLTDTDDDDKVEVDIDDPVSLQEAIARNLDRRQRKEREYFIQLLEESVSGEYRKAAQGMTQEEREDKVFELSEMYKNWSKSDDKNPTHQLNIFKEAIGTDLEMIKTERRLKRQLTMDEDLMASLLADLQEQQKLEAQRLLNDIENKDLQGLQQLHKAQQVLESGDDHSAVGAVLLGNQSKDTEEDGESEGETTEAGVIRALQDKYDAMKDQLLIEALIREHGDRKWQMMTETERQKKLLELKMKERKLRREGKMDEIADLIGSHLENEQMLDELFGTSVRSQKQKLQNRLARRKELIAERQAEGFATDDNTVDFMLDEEEKEEDKIKRRNILEMLQMNMDKERDELLETLKHQKDKHVQERERQITLAKLKRDKRRMEKGNKLETIASIIYTAKEDDKKREIGVEAEQERQRNVARERLEERKRKKKKKKQGQGDTEENLQHKEELVALEDALKEAEGQSIQEGVIVTIEMRQEEEMDLLMALLDPSKMDKELLAQTQAKSDAELKSDLTGLEQEHMRWKKKSKEKAEQVDLAKLTDQEKEAHMAQTAQRRAKLAKLLTQALAVRLEVERRELQQKQPLLTGDKLEEELQVTIVTSLQNKQISENRAVLRLIEVQDDKMLHKIKHTQHMACHEGWMDNLVAAIFHMSHPGGDVDEGLRIEESFQEAVTKMDKELESKREAEIAKARAEVPEGETFDEEAERARLLKEFDEKKQSILKEMGDQKAAMLKKLATRQMTREQKDYEDQMAKELVKLAKEQKDRVKVVIAEEKDRHADLLKQKLAERREARMTAMDVKFAMERENTLDMYDDDRKTPSSRPSSNDSTLPPFGLRREKTVVDVDVTEEQKQAILSQMVSQQRNLQNKIIEQQERQKEMLKRRLEARHGKQGKDEAAELISIGQRQKTILEKSKQDEKERQIQKMKAKVSRLREGRESSPMGPREK